LKIRDQGQGSGNRDQGTGKNGNRKKETGNRN